MNDPSHISFPYKRPVIKVKQASRKISLKEGIKRPIEKYGWISEGSLKPIEKGLPLIFGTKVSHSFEDVEISQKRFTDFVNKYKQFKSEDDYEGKSLNNDENDENEEEEESLEVYNPFKFLTDKAAAEQKELEDSQQKQTGISHPPSLEKNVQKASIIDAIAPIKFSSVKPSHEIKKPPNMNPFYHPRYEAKVKVPTKSTVPILKQQLKRVFKLDNPPFENIDKSEDFPTTMLLPMIDESSQNKKAKSELSMLKRANKIINPKNMKKVTRTPENNKKKIPALDNNDSSLLITEMRPDMYSKDTFINDNNQASENNNKDDKNDKKNATPNYDDLKDVPSTLIDSSKNDVFWTRNKTPFSRADIDHIFSWQIQNDAIITMIDEKRQKKMDEREEALMRTFESKNAFTHAIELVDKECKRLSYLGPGKSIKNKKSFWIEAAKYAKNDKSSLMYRKKKWNEFMKEIENSFNLLINQNKGQNKDDSNSSPNDENYLSNSQSNNVSNDSKKNEIFSNNKSCNNENIVDNSLVTNRTDESNNNIINDGKENNPKNSNTLMKNQIDFILRYKAAAMSGKEIDSSTFWYVIEPFQKVDFTHTEFCILVEILRSQLNVTKSEVISYLEEKDYPVLFYHLASTSPDFQPISNDTVQVTPKSTKKKPNNVIFQDSQKSCVFQAMQKKKRSLEQGKVSYESPPH